MRVLDSKNDDDQRVSRNAPMLMDYATEASKLRFQGVLEGLQALNIAYTVDPCLVRGLDY